MDLLPAILLGYAIGALPIGFLVAQGTRAVDIAATVVATLIRFRHRGNIARLWSRTDRAPGT